MPDYSAEKHRLLKSRIKVPAVFPNRTLDVARDKLKDNLAAGKSIDCQLCGQTVKVYARKLRASIINGLRALDASVYLSPAEMAAICGCRDYPFLAYFGLALRHKQSGTWRITQAGQDFLAGKITIPTAVLLFHGDVVGFDESAHLSIYDFKHEAFSIGDLLNPAHVTEAAINPFDGTFA